MAITDTWTVPLCSQCQQQLSHCSHHWKVSLTLSFCFCLSALVLVPLLIWQLCSVSSASKPSRKLSKQGTVNSSEQFGLAVKRYSTVILKIPNQTSWSPKRLFQRRNSTRITCTEGSILRFIVLGNFVALLCVCFCFFNGGGAKPPSARSRPGRHNILYSDLLQGTLRSLLEKGMSCYLCVCIFLYWFF